MYAKKLRRKCSVKGCRNIDTYSISLSRESGNSVIICQSCLEKALKAIDDIKPEQDVRVSPTEAPPLFFNRATEPVVEETPTPIPQDDETPSVDAQTDADAETPPSESAEFVCPHCGQVCKSELGLQKHIAAKHKG